jgi:hypothetical protein
MKKIFLILIFSIIVVSQAYSQGRVHYRSVQVNDSVFLPTGTVNAHTYLKDGVPFSSGGGDVYLGNRQTFAKRNEFNDTLKVTAIALFDSAKVSGSITAGFFKGSGEYVTNIIADNIALGSLTDAVLSSNIVKYSSFDTAYVAFLNQQNAFTKYALFSDSIRVTGMARFDSAIVKGNFKVSGNATIVGTLSVSDINGIDFTDFALRGYPNSFTDENTFMDAAYFNGGATFSTLANFTTAIFSGLATFVTATFSGVATFTNDIVPTWIKNQSSVNAYKYEKTKIIAGKLPSSVASTFTIAHGIANWHTIKSYTCRIMEDSSNVWVTPGLGSDPSLSGGKSIGSVWIDSLNCGLRVPSTNAENLLSDSVFFRLIYTDFSR